MSRNPESPLFQAESALQRPIIDAHIHMDGTLKDARCVIEYLDQNRIQLGFLIASPLKDGEGPKTDDMPSLQQWYLKGPNNSAIGRAITRNVVSKLAQGKFTQELDNPRVIEASRERPDRLFAWLFAKPEKEDEMQNALDKIKDAANDPSLNVAGIKVHFWIYPMDVFDYRMLHIADLARQLNNPILMDVGVDRSRMKRFDELAQLYPDVPIIAAHLGSPEIIEAAKRNTNVFLDMSGYTITGDRLRRVVKELASDKIVRVGKDRVKMPDASERIIFGSDSPGGLGGNIQDSLQVLKDANLSSRDEELILAGNIISLVPKAGQLLKGRQQDL